MEPKSLSSPAGMTSYTYNETHENTPKAHLQPNMNTITGLKEELLPKISLFSNILKTIYPFVNLPGDFQR